MGFKISRKRFVPFPPKGSNVKTGELSETPDILHNHFGEGKAGKIQRGELQFPAPVVGETGKKE